MIKKKKKKKERNGLRRKVKTITHPNYLIASDCTGLIE